MSMEIIDLSVPMDDDVSVPPNLPTFRQGRCVRHEESGYESDYITTSTHAGTHMDAPYHFDPEGRRIGDIPLEELIRPTLRADVRDVAEPDREITLDEVTARLPEPLGEDEFLFIHTGWSDEHINTTRFYGDNPYYADSIAEYIVEQKGRGLITDTSIDPGDRGYRNHYTLLENDKVIVENVINCDELPDTFTTHVIPIRLANGDGAPARVFVIKDEP